MWIQSWGTQQKLLDSCHFSYLWDGEDALPAGLEETARSYPWRPAHALCDGLRLLQGLLQAPGGQVRAWPTLEPWPRRPGKPLRALSEAPWQQDALTAGIWLLPRPLSLTCRRPCLLLWSSLGALCVLISSYYKDTIPTGLRCTPTTNLISP